MNHIQCGTSTKSSRFENLSCFAVAEYNGGRLRCTCCGAEMVGFDEAVRKLAERAWPGALDDDQTMSRLCVAAGLQPETLAVMWDLLRDAVKARQRACKVLRLVS